MQRDRAQKLHLCPLLSLADAPRVLGLPRLQRAPAKRFQRERPASGQAEHERLAIAAGAGLARRELGCERVEDRHAAIARRALGALLALDRVPPALHTDHACGEVDIAPSERSKLAAAQSGVERARPQRTFVLTDRRDERRRFGGVRDPVTPAVRAPQLEPLRRVDGDFIPFDRAAVDNTERVERVVYGARAQPLPRQSVGEVLHMPALHVGQPHPAKRRQDAFVEPHPVAAECGRLIAAARCCRD